MKAIFTQLSRRQLNWFWVRVDGFLAVGRDYRTKLKPLGPVATKASGRPGHRFYPR